MIPDFLKKTKNNLLINESDIATLKKYNIDVDNYKTIQELLYVINDILNNEDLSNEEADELEYIEKTLEERNYYLNTNK